MRSLSRPKQRSKVRGRKSRIELAYFGAHEESMALCSQEVQGEAVGADEAGVAVESSALARALSQAVLRVSFLVGLEAANVSAARINEVTPNERAGLKSA